MDGLTTDIPPCRRYSYFVWLTPVCGCGQLVRSDMRASLAIPTAILSLLLPFAVAGQNSSAIRYGPKFLWGVASSAHQTEGLTEGGVNADWYAFEHTPGNIQNGDTADVATDHWDRYRIDLDLARQLGVNSFRTSIAWEKVEPSRGVFNPEVIAHYREELQYMRSLGIRPMITLLHGTTPIWFEKSGGWLGTGSPQDFSVYADFVVRSLGDLCDLWVTINEPMVLIPEGYLEGVAPPQVASPESAIAAALNMIRGHQLATAAIHQIQPVPQGNQGSAVLRGVGLVNGIDVFDPMNPLDSGDVALTAIVTEWANWAFPAAAVYGDFKIDDLLSDLIGSDVRRHAAGVVANKNERSIVDWIGVNYYTHTLVNSVPNGLPLLNPAPGPKGDNGNSIYPAGIELVLRQAANRFPNIPLVVTENGLADAADRYRSDFIQDTLHYLDLAVSGHDGLPPVDVRGYYHWSMTDNFEWQSGYAMRFGLAAVLYDRNLQRVLRPSALVYSHAIKERK